MAVAIIHILSSKNFYYVLNLEFSSLFVCVLTGFLCLAPVQSFQ